MSNHVTYCYCWQCGAEYPANSLQCPACCATNANIDLDTASVEMCEASKIDHDWQFHDDSFDHEFGKQVAFHWECERCGKSGGSGVGINLKRTEERQCVPISSASSCQ